ncbi:MAG: hypothetical protein HS117_12130 [Verrucomicrobiaceae bacterium]|jgi:hypothetical protein|nr:hypothetical protein [Verrucomicrobiaceae bacterium]
MMPFLAAAIPLHTLLYIGAGVATIIIMWSFSHWRAAVKVALVIALLEGALRKWVFPQGQELMYFLKDVFLVGAYLRFFLAPGMEVRANKLRAPYIMVVVCCMFLMPAALNPNINSTLLAAYGVKIYVFYLPLMFMMPYLFWTKEEMVRQVTWYALIAIPIGLLGVAQWRAGGFSWLNVYADQTAMDQTGATTFGFGERVRITGTFSYITGHTTFVIFFSAITLAVLSLAEAKHKWLLMSVSLPLILGNALMGGSRASLFSIGLVFVGFALAAFSGRIGSNKNYTSMLMGGIAICAAGGLYFFGEALLHWQTRYKTAGDSVADRVIGMPLKAMQMGFSDAGFNGYGIGATHPAPEAIRRRLGIPAPKRKAPVFDTEMGQVLAELGIFGFGAWYWMRIAIIFTLIGAYLKCPPGAARPFILAAILISVPYLLLSVVLNHTANILLWALTGLGFIPLLEPAKVRRQVPVPRNLAAARRA